MRLQSVTNAYEKYLAKDVENEHENLQQMTTESTPRMDEKLSMNQKLESLLTPFVHKTVMRCSSSSAFFTENRITVYTKDVQIYLISFYLTFIIEIHCLNIE